MIKLKIFLLFPLAFLLLTTACNDDDEDEAQGNPPTVDAGGDLTGTVGSTISLQGTAEDPDGDQLTTSWSIVSSPANSNATINNASSLNASFIPDIAGPYTIRLSANDGHYDPVGDEIIVTAEEGDTSPGTTMIIDDDIDEDATWSDIFEDPSIPDYIVEEHISINAQLNIEPGVVVHLDEDVIVTVESGGGSMIAEGSEGNQIVFTSSDEAGQIYWGGIRFESSSVLNTLDHVRISYGGGANILYLYSDINSYVGANLAIEENGKVHITNSMLSDSEQHGLVAEEEGSILSFANNTISENNSYPMLMQANLAGMVDESSTFSGNGEDVVAIYGSTINENATYADADRGDWKALGENVHYLILGDITAEDSLVIAAGARLEFMEEAILDITESGYLKAIGSVEDPVVFTSTTQNSDNKWGGIRIESANSNNQIINAEVSYAGNANLSYFYDDTNRYIGANIALTDNGRLWLEDSDITNSADFGLSIESDGMVNNLTNADADPVTAISDVNTFSANNTENIIFEAP